MRSLPLLLMSSLLAGAIAPAAAQEVVIYRCEDAQGRLTLRDSPCEPGEKQQSRSMQRPRDPAPTSATSAAPASRVTDTPPTVTAPVVIYRAPPRPMYECEAPDGTRYTNDTGEGQARWESYFGYGYIWPRAHGGGGGGGGSGSPRPPPGTSIGVGTPPPSPPSDRPRPPTVGVVPIAGGWVRDECHMLPQAETCARLSDRRYEILRRYGSAMPSERRTLDLEQRGIDARMANDCRNP
ncbi:MAG TPA: DUF4124 domain-containing protein [Pseudoxanthomonas sp.]|jgi:hypothetical protein|nr:DUF4124 domain-containing protein [Pseudoxanthomonas sp.]